MLFGMLFFVCWTSSISATLHLPRSRVVVPNYSKLKMEDLSFENKVLSYGWLKQSWSLWFNKSTFKWRSKNLWPRLLRIAGAQAGCMLDTSRGLHASCTVSHAQKASDGSPPNTRNEIRFKAGATWLFVYNVHHIQKYLTSTSIPHPKRPAGRLLFLESHIFLPNEHTLTCDMSRLPLQQLSLVLAFKSIYISTDFKESKWNWVEITTGFIPQQKITKVHLCIWIFHFKHLWVTTFTWFPEISVLSLGLKGIVPWKLSGNSDLKMCSIQQLKKKTKQKNIYIKCW